MEQGSRSLKRVNGKRDKERMNKKTNVIKKRSLLKMPTHITIRTLSGVFLLLSMLLMSGCSVGDSNGIDTDTEVSDTTTSDTGSFDTESFDTESSDTGISDKESSDAVRPVEDGENIQDEGLLGEDLMSGDLSADSEEAAENAEPGPDLDVQSGKTLSILGDSISTFDGWIPEGYYDFFPVQGLTDVGQTWWKMVLDDTGMSLCINGSSSGSTCAGDSLGTSDPQHGCSNFRINGLAGSDGSSPDIIIVYMGTNDLIKDIPIGDNDGTRQVEEGNIENFSDAYSLILDKLHARYPNARIFCCNLPPVCGIGDNMSFVQMVNGQGLGSDSYSRQIEIIAASKGYPVIDLEHCGITVENVAQYVLDGVHLNPEGMKMIRDAVESAITDH